MKLYVNIKKKLSGFYLDVSFEAGTDTVGLLGASGSGKSMTLRCIAGLETPDSGRIVLNDRVLYDSEKGINLPSRKRKIGFLFQNYALFPNMTVEENIRFGLVNLKPVEILHKVGGMISMMHLEGLEKRYPGQLSGGQQQRVALARALVVEPEAFLLDEPLSALDDHLRDHMVKQLIDSLAEYKGVALFVTHNMEEAYRVCKNLVILSDGKKTASGSMEDIFKAPPTLAAVRLTGCKNISGARKLAADVVEALEWGCSLKVNSEMQVMSHVGIRAHHITLAGEADEKNVFPCWPSYTSETPFRMTVYLLIGKPPHGTNDYHIQWEITKEKWFEIKDRPLPWNICLKPERLILVNER